MKKYIFISFFALLFGVSACDDSFLNRTPIEQQTEATAFKTYANFETYAWSLYTCFTDNNFMQYWDDHNADGSSKDNNVWGRYEGDRLAGYLGDYNTTDNNPYRTQTAIVPTTGGGWDFDFIRKCQMMLDNVDKSDMSDADKAHWRSVGYFFHAYKYMELISRFGDVPWVNHVIGSDETDLIYGPRMPRKQVSDSVLAELQYAEKNIKPAGDGNNTINLNCIRALMSRFCLFEGAWRKYHNLGDADGYLDECIRVSAALMQSLPDVDPNYDNLMNSDDLSTYKGIILYKEYVNNILMNGFGYDERTATGKYEMYKATADMYLCSDGKPISISPLYAGDNTMYAEFRNRDWRLLLQVVPPYFETTGLNMDFTPNGTKNGVAYSDTTVNTQEYVDYLPIILSNPLSKRLPVFNWSGTMNWMSPNVSGPGQGPMASRSGYYMWRNYNLWDANNNGKAICTCDKPLLYIEETMLNYAEAMFERGQFTQAVADATINKLRKRVNVANMIVADINASFDPNRDQTVDPVLWEIRRERMVELMGEGFGFQDIRRWAKGPWFINRDEMGVHVNIADFKGTTATINAWKALQLVDKDFNSVTNEGYLKRFGNPVKDGKGWDDKYYLFPIPLNELALDPQLVQNPGW